MREEAMRGLQGKVAIVAGGGSGIGAATARRLAEAGASVVVGDLKPQAADAVAGRIHDSGGRALGVGFDVTDEPSVARLIAAAIDAYGGLDAIHINFADLSIIFQDKDALSTPLEVFDRTIAVDLRGHLVCTRHALPALLARGGGSIVYTVSGAAFVGSAEYVCYSMAKAGITALMRHVATKWGREGIRANAVAPGLVLTDAVRAGMSDEAKSQVLAMGRSPRLGQPQDLAGMVALLMSDEGEWITGQVVSVDGGATMR
jgi:NAD(P)-dependent dehydrogenase (short-subunit alcohol dehydrogenase family)